MKTNKYAVILDCEGHNYSELGLFDRRSEAINSARNKAIDYSGYNGYILVQNRKNGKFVYRKTLKGNK